MTYLFSLNGRGEPVGPITKVERIEDMKKEQTYVSRFLSLRCSGDVLNACGPIHRAEKEITESYGVVRRLRTFAMAKPMHYTLMDFGAGNCLTATMAVHLLPFKKVIAIDKRPQSKRFISVSRFEYLSREITSASLNDWDTPIIVTSTHGCGELSNIVCQMFKQNANVEGIVLLPCCSGKKKVKVPNIVTQTLGPYLSWCMSLAMQVNGNAVRDEQILSPCNCVVTAKKE